MSEAIERLGLRILDLVGERDALKSRVAQLEEKLKVEEEYKWGVLRDTRLHLETARARYCKAETRVAKLKEEQDAFNEKSSSLVAFYEEHQDDEFGIERVKQLRTHVTKLEIERKALSETTASTLNRLAKSATNCIEMANRVTELESERLDLQTHTGRLEGDLRMAKELAKRRGEWIKDHQEKNQP